MEHVSIGMIQIPFMVYQPDSEGSIMTQIELDLPDGLLDRLRAAVREYYDVQEIVRDRVERGAEISIEDRGVTLSQENEAAKGEE